MFGRVERRGFEWLKAALSLVALAAGILLSDASGTMLESRTADAADIVGVWRWVADVPAKNGQHSAPVLEIRRDLAGELELRILAGTSEHRHGGADGTIITYDDGHLCVVAGDGTSFNGRISEDGTQIEGVVHRKGTRSSAHLERVARWGWKVFPRRTYST